MTTENEVIGKLNVKALKHKNVYGKEIIYIIISVDDDQIGNVVINVGEKTYKGVIKLLEMVPRETAPRETEKQKKQNEK